MYWYAYAWKYILQTRTQLRAFSFVSRRPSIKINRSCLLCGVYLYVEGVYICICYIHTFYICLLFSARFVANEWPFTNDDKCLKFPLNAAASLWQSFLRILPKLIFFATKAKKSKTKSYAMWMLQVIRGINQQILDISIFYLKVVY